MPDRKSQFPLRLKGLYANFFIRFLMGKAAAVVNEKKSARAIVDELVGDAVKWIQTTNGFIVSKSKL